MNWKSLFEILCFRKAFLVFGDLSGMAEQNYTYLLKCADGSFYCGWTNDLDKRGAAHNRGSASKYTRTRRPVELVYYETFPTKQGATRREYWIKQLTRQEKEKLIEGRQKMTSLYDVTVIGPAIVDVVAGAVDEALFQKGTLPVDRIRMSYGGNALNEAVVLSRLGHRVQLITMVGEDEAGKNVLGYMEENGLDTDSVQVRKDISTSINVVLYDASGERRFLTDPKGSQRQFTLVDAAPYLDRVADWVSFPSMFVSPAFGIKDMDQMLTRLKEKKDRRILLDMTHPKNRETVKDITALLEKTDYFLPNEEECALLGIDPKDPKPLFDAGLKCLVSTMGKEGVRLCDREKTICCSAYPKASVVDTTGAGDTFAAGFLHSLIRGRSLPDALSFASAAASFCVETVGAGNWDVDEAAIIKRGKKIRME